MAASITLKPTMFFSLSRNLLKQQLIKTTLRNFCASVEAVERDPFPIFLDQNVQQLLHRVTGFDPLKVAGPQKRKLKRPTYKLLTDEELEQDIKKANERLQARLQIPPYMNPRKPKLTPLITDPDLAGFDKSDYVFVDVSFGLHDRKRSVVIRDPQGTLKEASWDVKERMNQIFNPKEGKQYFKPKMFEEQILEKLIADGKYVYILDRACCQFEPDDPDFIRTTHRVYNAINSKKDFDVLRSTRHFGSIAFYLTWNKMIDNLLLDMINRDLLSDAKDLVTLYCIIHPSSSCSQVIKELKDAQPEQIIKAYITTDAKQKPELELSIQAFEDAKRSREKKKTG
ncbi:small ribosomal subunit protein mS22-like [Physella acuta]|uniref:small ribosomal subunit protein mS22-like n=1 Tax=Physella acuta TaxID=109671 RepID=UPI0027DC9C67|nr:small ribosomal subunit protein mS22-like [Physella acuta]